MSGTNGPDVRATIVRIFEQTRETPGTPYEPKRLLAFLTEPPGAGTRVADTFAGRRRWVRFMNAVQLELGICFTQEEWDRGFGLDQLVEVATAKAGAANQQLRLARKRLEEARRRRTSEPIKFAVLLAPILIGAVVADSWLVKGLLLLLWAAGVGGIAVVSFSEVRYYIRLMTRVESEKIG
jgi:hypothetical protein